MVGLSIVVPTFNEGDNVLDFLRDVEAAVDGRDYEVVVVDDNSPDGTYQKVVAYAQDHPRVRPILRVNEKGLATAVIRGMKEAVGEFVVVMDSDYQHPPSTIPRLHDAALREDADCVVASRYAPGGSVTGFPVVRKVISWGARMLAVWGLPVVRRFRVRDPMSGFFLVRKSQVPLDELRPRGYKILVEVLARGRMRRVVEVGFGFQNRRAGESKLRVKTQVDYFLHVARLATESSENRRFATYAAVGTSGILVNLAALYLLVDVLDWRHRLVVAVSGQDVLVGSFLAGVLGWEAALVWNFVWNDRFTFHRERAISAHGFVHRFLRFHVVSLWAFLVYLLLYYPLVHFGVAELVASLIAVPVAFLVNYAGNVRWTWAGRVEPNGK